MADERCGEEEDFQSVEEALGAMAQRERLNWI
jgi:hypothetical protein